MTRIDFYVLRPGARSTRERLLCTLAGKAWREGHRVYIQAHSQEQAQALDDLLWTYHDVSFIPHDRVGADLAAEAPILIGHGEPPAGMSDVMINLMDPVPEYCDRFDRVIEIVDEEPERRACARLHYRRYQERGFPVATHDIVQDHE